MKDRFILFLAGLLIIFNINLIAQEVLLYGSVGYNVPISQTYGWSFENDYSELNKTKFSKGFTYSGGVSYFFIQNFGCDLKISYLSMKEKEEYTKIEHRETIIEYFSNSNLSIVPTLILKTSTGKFNPYMKFGFSINFVNVDLSSTYSYSTNYNTTNTYSNDFSIGTNASLGCNYTIDEHFIAFSELSFSSFTFYADKRTNGDTGIEFDLKDKFEGTGIAASEIARAFPFSSINISIGLKYRL